MFSRSPALRLKAGVRSALIGVLLAICSPLRAADQVVGASIESQPALRTLVVGTSVERTLRGGEAHTYQLVLASGQFVRLSVVQKAVDAVITIVGPDEQPLLRADDVAELAGTELLTFIANARGAYRVKVEPTERTALGGEYEITVIELRPATDRDRGLQEANELTHQVEDLHSAGEYDKALPLAEQAVSIREAQLGPRHPDVATALDNLAWVYEAKADYVRAEPLYLRALGIRETTLGDHPATADSLNNLALLYDALGDYAKEEPLLVRAVAIYEKTRGKDHPDTAISLNNLGMLHRARGDYGQASKVLVRALAILERTVGEHPDTAMALNNLAIVHYLKDDYAEAEPLFLRALAIREKVLGSEHPLTAGTINNLAHLYKTKRKFADAKALFRRALAIKTQIFGPDHPDVALAVNNLAVALEGEGDYANAESLYRRALTIWEKTLGPAHPNVAQSLNNLASLYRALDDVGDALTFQQRGNEARELGFRRNLMMGSERQKVLYLRLSNAELDQTLSLHVQAAPNSHQARRMALTILLLRKGRALDAMTDNLALLRSRTTLQDQAIISKLLQSRERLAQSTLKGPGKLGIDEHRAHLREMEDEVDRLEGDLSARSAEFRTQSQAVSIEAVQDAIPAGAVLLEFATYKPYDAKADTYGAARYVAYALAADGEPSSVDLGDSSPIDDAISSFRAALRDPKRTDVGRWARTVDAMIMEPTRKLLGRNKWLLISPDGALNLVPFGALADPDGQYLIRRYQFTYLTSGRDLLRLQVSVPAKQGSYVLADPDFGDGPHAKGSSTRTPATAVSATQSRNHLLGQLHFAPLPGTVGEGEALRRILPDVTLLTRREATKANLYKLNGPRILHIATHGFFLENLTPTLMDARVTYFRGDDPARLFVVKDTGSTTSMHVENPLLRSGLALAGANNREVGDGEGILTALEVAGLSLSGTKLVVLSACDTGVGEIRNGDGVYGLRRSLVLAGAESQVMSLWPVSDAATRDLMVSYYTGLQAGRGRSEALRDAQLEMMRDPARNHPAFWASFIQSGQWNTLSGAN